MISKIRNGFMPNQQIKAEPYTATQSYAQQRLANDRQRRTHRPQGITVPELINVLEGERDAAQRVGEPKLSGREALCWASMARISTMNSALEGGHLASGCAGLKSVWENKDV